MQDTIIKTANVLDTSDNWQKLSLRLGQEKLPWISIGILNIAKVHEFLCQLENLETITSSLSESEMHAAAIRPVQLLDLHTKTPIICSPNSLMLSSAIANMWIFSVYEVLRLLCKSSRVENLSEHVKSECKNIIEKVELIRIPLAKMEVASTKWDTTIAYPQLLIFPEDRCFGWKTWNKKGEEYNISRKYISGYLLNLLNLPK